MTRSQTIAIVIENSAAQILAKDRLLRSLDTLSAAAASAPTATGSSIEANVDHVRYGLSLMNRWSAGDNPFTDADWSASWKKTQVSDDEWQRLRAELRTEATRWLNALRTPRDVQQIELNGMIGSIAHLAYHLGAIRQLTYRFADRRKAHDTPLTGNVTP